MTTDEKVTQVARALLRIIDVLDGTSTGTSLFTDPRAAQDLGQAKAELRRVLSD
jgi:hypothetical protein